MSWKVLYVLSSGFSARTVLHTDVVPELRSRGASVAALCPGFNNPSIASLAARLGVEMYFTPSLGNRWVNEYLRFRRYLFEDVRRNPALWAKHLQDTSPRTPALRRWGMGLAMALNQVARAGRLSRWLSPRREQVFYRSRRVRAVLKAANPSLVVATYPVNLLEATTLAEASRLGIPTVIQLLSWDNITSKGRFPVLADHFLSWGPVMSEELSEYYRIPRERIRETGVAHFDAHVKRVDPAIQAKILGEMGLPTTGRYLLFGMSSPYFAPREIDIVEQLAREVARGDFGNDVSLVVRPHPQNVYGYLADNSWLPRLKALACQKVGICWPKAADGDLAWSLDEDDLTRLVNVVAGCSVCLNSGSTFAIDALAHDKPVVFTFFDADQELHWECSARRARDFIHMKKLLKCGGGREAQSFAEMRAMILVSLSNPSLDRDARWRALSRECGEIKGTAALQIAEALSGIQSTEVNIQQGGATT